MREEEKEKTKNEIAHKGFLNMREARDEFEREAAWLGDCDVVPLYRVVMLFGDWVEDYFNEPKKFQLGRDYNMWGVPSGVDIDYLYESGYLKVVKEHNLRLMQEEIKELIMEEAWHGRREKRDIKKIHNRNAENNT